MENAGRQRSEDRLQMREGSRTLRCWDAGKLGGRKAQKKIKRIQMAETLNSEVGSWVAEYKKAQIPLEPSSLPASRLPSLPAFLPLRLTPWVLSYTLHH
jgi:hypothetical protein